ncbi:Cleavage stimulation factor subunit 2 [Lasiodiplodia hormozganensis]|uniref:Cleavage stimulation factor subunit 2 n=2 Tax=Lasiodiplodia TaxID=66739 RepID=A0A5N5D1T9_9PEZI|nr:Polyadenylation factor subunit 64 [Lasiodiplodia theobromae]KAB2571517.1 Cleavage stimulation factor subunit 2 [Lasiodiplodia theobromae]KAF4536115.1 Polyadenylation factor subunit 64 [Lasiodiplodia theobromae]KAK0625750.1 Cleavage stimulation factor subunit 2 [Lasiodiplodia hormozganensis]
MPPEKGGRVVFIGNIPYGVSEELITETLSRVGQVLNFRLVYDKDSGRPKGFGFAEFSDAEDAASAVRNLNDYELMGRKLRVDYSNDNGAGDSAPANYNPPQVASNGQDAPASNTIPPLPPGVDVPPNLTCPDAISKTLQTLPPPQLLDILSQMKGLVTTDPAKATELLRQAPQLSFAIFQALLLLGLIDQSLLTSVVDTATIPQAEPQPQPAATPMPPQAFPGYPPQQASRGVMNVPTPPVGNPYQQPPMPMQQQPAQPQVPLDQQALIRQVMAMTPETIASLPPNDRAQIEALRARIMSTGSPF